VKHRDAALDSGRLDDLLSFNLRRAQLAAFAIFPATMGDTTVTPVQLAVLFLIDANPMAKQTALAAAIQVERSTMVRIVDQLVALGLVERSADPRDRRVAAPTLTAKGSAYVQHATERIAVHERRIARGLSREERATLLSLLRRVVR
jgi:DNA-binding MarR family transcriptional regulator